MCDDTPPFESLESWVPCDIFETHIFEEDCFKQNEECNQGFDTSDEASFISDIDGDDDYWTFIENPTYDSFENIFENLIYDVSSEGSFYSETYESCKEEQSEFSYDHPDLYLSIYNEDLKKQCSEESDGVQLDEFFS